MYAVMFCHEFWQEELEFASVGSSENMFNFTQTLEERS